MDIYKSHINKKISTIEERARAQSRALMRLVREKDASMAERNALQLFPSKCVGVLFGAALLCFSAILQCGFAVVFFFKKLANPISMSLESFKVSFAFN